MNLICGINPVLEALSAGTRHFDRLLVVKGTRNHRVSDVIARASHMGIPLRFEGRDMLDRLAGAVPHQGVIAVVSAKPTLDVHELLDQARTPSLFVVLDGVEDPRNLGAILRTSEAAGVDGVLLPERHSVGLSETVARASAGALEHVKVARVGNVSQALQAMKARGVWVVGFDAAGTERWDAVDYRGPVAIVLGGEGRGMRRLVREHCDHLVSLPLMGHVGSLNVSVAAGIALYEVVRQRGLVPSHVRPIPPGAARPAGRQVTGPAADDTEDDPGHAASAPATEEGGEVHDVHDEVEEHPQALFVHDEVDWSAPVVITSRERARKIVAGDRRSLDRPRHGRKRREGREGRERPEGREGREGRHDRGDRPRERPDRPRPEGQGQAAPAPEGGAPPEERAPGGHGEHRPPREGDAHRKRRRRRGRPEGQPPAAHGQPREHRPPRPEGPGEGPPAPSGTPAERPPQAGGTGEDGDRRPRRRRRRRH